jgi:aminomethyltransferase
METQAMIAVQGPHAEAILQPLCDTYLSDFAFRDVREISVLGESCVLARGGYTGCDGFEWMGDARAASRLWQQLVELGAVPCGLGARDVLRLEAGLPLYGHELREEWTPFESGVGFAVKWDKGAFHGREALENRHSMPVARTIRGVEMSGRAIAREGYAVWHNDELIGEITSGTPSPTLEKNIALALLPAHLPVETEIEIQIRGVRHPARIVNSPFVARSTKTSFP